MLFFKRLAEKNEEVLPGSIAKMYAALVNEKVRARYSQSDENAILRKKLANMTGAQAEFDEFNTFVEQCKSEARKELDID